MMPAPRASASAKSGRYSRTGASSRIRSRSTNCMIASAVNDLLSEAMGRGVAAVMSCPRASCPKPVTDTTSLPRVTAMATPGTPVLDW